MVLAVSGRLDNLPAELTSFVDRRHELTEARSMLGTSRLVTLVGSGGVGKTRLAIRVASDVRRSFPDGVWFVDLSALRSPDLLAASVAEALNLVLSPGRSAIDTLADYFRDQRALLVLDNCEHLLDGTATLLSRLLTSGPDLRILATSREPIGAYGEALLSIPAMTVPDARVGSRPAGSEYESVTLFVNRALDAYPQFEASDENMKMVGEICFRLDGVPLAIELAAVRLRALSLPQILARLSDPYRLLTGGSRSGPQRQRTLRSSIEWSYELCSAAEQQLWARLSVFAGGWELDAVEGICVDDDRTEPNPSDPLSADNMLDLLQSLVEKSVVMRVEDGQTIWYRMLETIREFALGKARESGQTALLAARHRDWYEELLVQAEADWISPRQRYWLARMHREIPNLRTALEFSLTAGASAGAALSLIVPAWRICWWAAGRVDELHVWIDRALERNPDQSRFRTRAIMIKAYISAVQRQPDLHSGEFDQAYAYAEEVRDARSLGIAAAALGIAADTRGELDETVRQFERGRDALAGTSELAPRLIILALLAAGYDEAGDRVRAQACADEVLTIAQAHGERFEQSYMLLVLGVSAWTDGDLDRAADLVSQCLRHKRELGDPVGAAMAVQTLACIASAAYDFDRAARLLGATELLWSRSGAIRASFPAYERYCQECERQTRAAMNARDFATAFDSGRQLDVVDAVSLALNEAGAPGAPKAVGPTSSPLTRREQEIAGLVAQGMSNKQIAATLVIAARTAEGHVERVLSKLGFTSRTQIVSWVGQHPELISN